MKNLSVARRYAKALLLIGSETGEAETYRSELANVSGLLDQVKEFDQVINNPLYGTSVRMNILKAIIEKINPTEVIRSFMLLLF